MKAQSWLVTVLCVLLWLGTTLHAQPQPTKETGQDVRERRPRQQLFYSLCGRGRHICFTDGWCAKRKECDKKKKGIKRHMNERYENPPDYEAEVMCYTKNNVHRCVLSVMS
ncbi:uncharacterized protein LOC118405462 [Branchiostoma floridae]|uniref:Uncharacterized protein LOC118405462 n=1 Tax=Branchiostoma floridae TaxID=7739 RepID=A0A9J7HK16_BRAFL|nr:uncharacterized protein LOC118405462 [Branchiostoma floridae]